MNNNKTIILCGSMKFKDKFYEIKDILENIDFNVFICM